MGGLGGGKPPPKPPKPHFSLEITVTSQLHVVFGTGPLAQSVVRALIKRGHLIRMVNRSSTRPAGVPDQVEVVAGDAFDVAFTRFVTQGAVAVYQCAQPAYQDWVTQFPRLQASILDGAAANAACLVLAENLYMYGEVAGKIHEELPYNATTRKGRVRARISQDALAAHRAGKVQVTIGRGSDFFGPAVLDSTLGERAILPALAGKTAQLVGNLDLPHTYTYIGDFGEALAILAERSDALGQAWHVPNDSPSITQRELMGVIFEEIGLPPRMNGMGRLMMAIGGLFIPEARESVEMMYEFEKPFVVDSSKFEQAFGMGATPIREAVRQTVTWFRDIPR
jgi:nucleoside-diphosphate-sugar epimerase